MNLSAYDNVKYKIDKTKSWFNIKKKLLVTREIKYRKYYTLSERYEPKSKEYHYFVIMLDDEPENRISHITNLDDYGRIKIKLDSLFNKTILSTFTSDRNINIIHVDGADDGDIYKLDL